MVNYVTNSDIGGMLSLAMEDKAKGGWGLDRPTAVKEIAKIIIITDIVATWSFNNNWKKARSGMTLLFDDTATKPLNPIKKTIGIMIKKEIIKLFFNTLLFFAAYTLCQFPWWKRFVAATAIKKVRPAVKLGI